LLGGGTPGGQTDGTAFALSVAVAGRVCHALRRVPRIRETAVISCGYDGWTDAPEDEREGLDIVEAGWEEAVLSSAEPLMGSTALVPSLPLSPAPDAPIRWLAA
jgi:hypothetical protein